MIEEPSSGRVQQRSGHRHLSGPVWSSSNTLKLFYWDGYSADNTQWIQANVSVVPEPGALSLGLAGLGVIGLSARRRRACETPA